MVLHMFGYYENSVNYCFSVGIASISGNGIWISRNQGVKMTELADETYGSRGYSINSMLFFVGIAQKSEVEMLTTISKLHYSSENVWSVTLI